MGAWGTDTLSNDSAADFLLDVVDSRDCATLISQLFDRVLSGGDGESSEEEALAGAEVIAAALGRPSPLLSEETAEASKRNQQALSALAAKGREVVVFIRNGESDLKECWAETDEYSAWGASPDDLLARLQGIES